MTNFEKLKADIQGMTVEEFAAFLDTFVLSHISMKRCDLNWLESEAKQ